MPAVFPSSSRAELIAFFSGNHYDLILLQETHLSSTKKFQIPGYYTFCTDRTFGRRGPVSSDTHNTCGGVLTLIHSDLAFSPVSVSSPSSQDPYSDYTCVKVLLSNHSPLQFLYLYSPPIRNSPFDFRILPNFPDTFILGDFNAHYPTWDRLIPPNPLGNDLFRWITSSGLEILNDPASPTLLQHSTGSRSSPDILLAPASLTLHCEWRTLHGLGSDHLPIEIVLSLFPVRQPNTRPPKFNSKKNSWDIYQSYIAEHLPCLDFDALNIHQAAHSPSLFLVEAAKASISFGRLGRSPEAWWSQEAESAVWERRRARSVAHRSESHRLRYINGSRRASSVISRAKSATWQATCSNLSPRSDPRAVTGCLFSTPSSRLLLEAQLPPLKLTLEHQTLYSFERALRLPPDFSSLYALAIRNVPCRLKKKPSCRSFCSSATQPLPSPRKSLITCPPFPPWSTTHFSVSPFIPDCSGNSTLRLQTASSGLSSLPLSDIQVWTDGSVPSLFGPGGAGVYAPNATHRIPYPFPPVQLPPASQLKPVPSSKALLGVLAI